jgi:hypothetical protein
MMSKRQTHREVGAQSHGSVRLMRTDWQTARPPKFLFGGSIYIGGDYLERTLSIYPLQIEIDSKCVYIIRESLFQKGQCPND